MQKTLIVIAGPTAIGKTDLTLELAGYFNTEIISADSRQVFRELTIGTAVPSPDQLAAISHHFIQHISIHDIYNASAYEKEALARINQLFQTYDLLFMTGGSGMYIDAVCYGIDEMPDIEPEIRRKATNLLQTQGKGALQEILKNADPAYYHETDLQNTARLIRGVEIYWQTGKPFSAFRTKQKKKRNFNIIRIALDTERAELHQRINERTNQMMEQGLVAEVSSLRSYQHLVPLKTVGYREIFDYLNGRTSLNEAAELIKRNTRRYARKQLSWFRRTPSTQWFYPEHKDQIVSYINQKLDENAQNK